MQQDAVGDQDAAQTPEDCYILFPSHTDGWRLYELSRDAGVKARISPTPRMARASCGVSLLASCDDVGALAALAAKGGVQTEGWVRLPRQIDVRRDRFC